MNGQNSADIPIWPWVAFGAMVAVLLAINLFLSRGKKKETRAYAIGWSIVWISAAVIFGGFVWFVFGANRGHEYFAAWLMEESLSLDNLFVFFMIFQSLGIEDERDQHKVLFWGILGAVVFRGVFIFLGAAVLEQWKWVSFVFGALLLYAAWKAFRNNPTKHGRSPVLRWLSRRLPVKENAPNGHFIAEKDARSIY